MISILLLLLELSNCIQIPKFGILMVNDGGSEEDVQQGLQYMKKNINEMCQYMSEYISMDLCVATYNSLQDMHFSNGLDINQKLSTFSSSDKLLIISGKDMKQEIDFNNLKSQMGVQIINSFDESEDSDDEYYKQISKKSKMANISPQINKVVFNYMKNIKNDLFTNNKISHKHIKKEYVNPSKISIVGNIEEKVSFLTIAYATIIITKSELNCHTFALTLYSKIAQNSQKIRSTNFIVDITSYWNNDILIEGTDDMIQTNLFGISYYQDIDEKIDSFRISYNNNYWSVECRNQGSSSYEDLDDIPIKVPYTRTSIFNFIVYAFDFDIHLLDDVNLDDYKTINITAKSNSMDFTSIFGLKNLDKNELKITKSGDWDNLDGNKMPIVAVAYNPEEVNFVPDETLGFDFRPDTSIPDYGGNNDGNNGGGSTGKSNSQKTGIIIGVVIGVIVIVAIIIIIVVVVIRKKKAKHQSESEGEGAAEQ